MSISQVNDDECCESNTLPQTPSNIADILIYKLMRHQKFQMKMIISEQKASVCLVHLLGLVWNDYFQFAPALINCDDVKEERKQNWTVSTFQEYKCDRIS